MGRSPLPVLVAAFGAILLTLAGMVVASDSVGRALVERHENEVQLSELLYGADRLQARVTEQTNAYSDFLRAPAPIRLQLYRAAHQAVLDQLLRVRDAARQRPELQPAADRLDAVTARWDSELSMLTRRAVEQRDGPPVLTPEVAALIDELALAYADAIRDYAEVLEDLRAENRRRGQALADQFQAWVRIGGVVGALLVLGVGLASTLTIRRSVRELALSRRAIVQAQESIRREVAERLHGEVQGKLLALELQLRQALAQLDRDAAAARQTITTVAERLGVVRDTARAISHQLHPAILRMGLPAALRSLRDGLEPSVSLSLEVAPEIEQRELRGALGGGAGLPPLPEAVRLALYRLVQEGVNNAVRHGGVREVRVRVWAPRADQVAVSVEDRGRGLPRGASPGLGLASLRGAVEALGGQLHVSGAPGRGTRLVGVVPVPTATSTNGSAPREAAASAP
jgi:signal transduction histidine kinase